MRQDQIDIQGKDSAAGFLSQGKSMIRFSEPILTPSSVGKNIASEDAHVISILRKAGAIFYCKTTLPQAIMHLETDSYLGPTTNPYQRHVISSGGSSGGEGALLAMHGSPLGIGTDIGGSIRSVCSQGDPGDSRTHLLSPHREACFCVRFIWVQADSGNFALDRIQESWMYFGCGP